MKTALSHRTHLPRMLDENGDDGFPGAVAGADQARSERLAREALQGRYAVLWKQWYEESCFFSSTQQILGTPAALEIHAMGRAVVPLLRASLAASQRSPAVMSMLHAILQDGPEIPEDEHGYIECMQQRWLAWLEGNV